MAENAMSTASVGTVIALQGSAQAVFEGETRELSSNSEVFQGDTLITARGSHLEIQFQDNTSLSLGETSEININSYVYDSDVPTNSDLLLQMTKGVFRTITGEIAEQNPDNFKLKSPLATIGIRGTTVVSDVKGGVEKHGVEAIGDGHVLVVQDAMGNIQFISDPLQIIDFLENQPIQPARPLTSEEQAYFQTNAPSQNDGTPDDGAQDGTSGEDTGEEAGGGGGDDGQPGDAPDPQPNHPPQANQTTYKVLGLINYSDLSAPVFYALAGQEGRGGQGHDNPEDDAQTLFNAEVTTQPDPVPDPVPDPEPDPEPDPVVPDPHPGGGGGGGGGGGSNDLTLTGTADSDTLTGGTGNDTIWGAAGDDNLDGGPGNDRLYGECGNDKLIGGQGNDLLNGGTSTDPKLNHDIADYSDDPGFVTVNLATGTATDGWVNTDTLVNIEAVMGSNHYDAGNINLGDSLTGSPNDEGFFGTLGSDSINGGLGKDLLSYAMLSENNNGFKGVTIDLTDTSAGGDGTAIGKNNSEGILFTDKLTSIEVVAGSKYADTLKGTDNADGFFVSFGDDTIYGDADGGTDSDKDWIDYSAIDGQSDGVHTFFSAYVDLQNGWAKGKYMDGSAPTEQFTDTLDSVEDVFGSAEADTIKGSTADNWLDGRGGDDTIIVDSGNNTLVGGAGNDSITGGSGVDLITGGEGVDVLVGGLGNDKFIYDSNLTDATGSGESITGGDGTNDTIVVAGGTNAVDFSDDVITTVETLELALKEDGITTDPYAQSLTMTSDQIGSFTTINAVHNGTTGDAITLSEAMTTAMLDGTVINGGLQLNLYADADNSLTLVNGTLDGTDLLFINGANITSDYSLTFDGSAELDNTTQINVTGGAGDDNLKGGAGNDKFIYDSNFTDATGSGEYIAGKDGTDTIVVAGGTNAVDFSDDIITTVETLELTKTADGTATDDFAQALTMTSNQINGLTTINAAHTGTAGDTITLSDQMTDQMLTYGSNSSPTAINGGLQITLLDGIGSHELTINDGVLDNTDLLVINGADLTGSNCLTFDGSLQSTTGKFIVTGGGYEDSIKGGAGADTLFGGDGADTLEGGDGTDTLWGGAGADTLKGGGGIDTFQFKEYAAPDTIKDFTAGAGGDILYFDESSLGTNFSADGGPTYTTTTTGGIDINPTAFKVVGITDAITSNWDTIEDVATFINSAVDAFSMGDGSGDDTYFLINKEVTAGVFETRAYYWDGDVDTSGSVDASELDLITTLTEFGSTDISNLVDDNFQFTEVLS